MKLWSDAHSTLLDALRAQHFVPKLWRRLSFERYEASPDDVERLRDWPHTLMLDPGWEILAPSLDSPEAWPTIWHQASDAGWSTVNHHHHALLFWRLTTKFIQDQEYERASWAWGETLSSWRFFLGDESYIQDLLEELVEPADDDAQEQSKPLDRFGEIITQLPQPLVRTLLQALRESLGLDRPAGTKHTLDRRAVKFYWNALNLLDVTYSAPELKDPFGALQSTQLIASSGRATLVREIRERWSAQVDAMDLSTIERSQALEPFEWLQSTSELTGIDSQSAVFVVEKVVELCWSLEKIGRGKSGDLLEDVLATTKEFNDALEEHVQTGDAFGHQAKCADFLVFEGDLQENRDDRFLLFKQALAICPGHRNASLLLSYEHLQKVVNLLAQAEAMGATSVIVPRAHQRFSGMIEQMHQHLEQAWEVYPFNERFGEYAFKVQQQAERLKIDLPASAGAWRDAIDGYLKDQKGG